MTERATPEFLSDSQLLVEVRRLVGNERAVTARLIAALGELDARRLYLCEGCSSLFSYCTQVLHLSEHAAYSRIEAARAARKWPVVLELLAEGSLHLTAVALLGRHFTAENHRELLTAARHQTKREVEEIIAALRPQPAIPSTVRKLPERQALSPPTSLLVSTPLPSAPPPPAPGAGAHTESGAPTAVWRPEVKPVSVEQYKVQFTMSRETHLRLREAQDLLRHQLPSGDIGEIFSRASRGSSRSCAGLVTPRSLVRARHGRLPRRLAISRRR